MVTRSCKYTGNQLVWRIRIPKLNLDLVPKSCKNTLNQVVWRIRIWKVIFSKWNSHRELEAFVEICLSLVFLNFGRWPVLIGLIGPIQSFFRGRTFSDTCGARTFFQFHKSVGACNPKCLQCLLGTMCFVINVRTVLDVVQARNVCKIRNALRSKSISLMLANAR